MKNIILKSTLLIPVLLFADYLLIMIMGCIAGIFDSTANFYECDFCTIGKVILSISIAALVIILWTDIKLVLGIKN